MKLHLKPAHIVWLRILEQRISALDTRHGSGQNPSQLSWPSAFDSDFTCQLKQVVGPSCILWQVVRQVGCQLNQYLSPFRSARNFSTSVSQYQQRYQEPTRPKQNPKHSKHPQTQHTNRSQTRCREHQTWPDGTVQPGKCQLCTQASKARQVDKVSYHLQTPSQGQTRREDCPFRTKKATSPLHLQVATLAYLRNSLNRDPKWMMRGEREWVYGEIERQKCSQPTVVILPHFTLLGSQLSNDKVLWRHMKVKEWGTTSRSLMVRRRYAPCKVEILGKLPNQSRTLVTYSTWNSKPFLVNNGPTFDRRSLRQHFCQDWLDIMGWHSSWSISAATFNDLCSWFCLIGDPAVQHLQGSA